MDSKYFQTVRDSVSGQRDVDEETFNSLAVLHERLERLKKVDSIFEAVGFSPAVQKMAAMKRTAGVC